MSKKVKNINECPICKARKTAILENWVGIDKILFKGKKPSEVLSKEKLIEFREIKGSFLLNLFEIYKEINHVSKNRYNDQKELVENVSKKVVINLKETKEFLKTPSIKKALIEEININVKKNKLTLQESQKKTVLMNLFRTSIDKWSLQEALQESSFDIQKTEKGRLIIGAHRGLRDKLISIVI